MMEQVNKPRVFLSHSSLDVAFIERIESDLRRCQIDSWRDRTEIRDGRRWQQVIFKEGIPTCDVIIGYFTENSLTSDMFAKEVDAAQLQQLQDNAIVFLPYVNNPEIRSSLRLDIQSLQCRVWNDDNYYEVLPSVVAEVWRSYMERTVATAVLRERNGRLEAELNFERLQARLTASAFTAQEESDFQHIYTKLKEPVKIYCPVLITMEVNEKSQAVEVGRCNFKVPFVEPLFAKISKGATVFGWGFLDGFENIFESETRCITSLPSSLPEGDNKLEKPHFEQDLTSKLIIHGLVKEERHKANLGRMEGFYTSSYNFTEKMYRFISWLEYHNKVGDKFSVEFTEFVDKSSYSKKS